ncbi:MAG: hypoxanthine phosphoribosyltransferase [bacterium]|jgi:hypoxanthine phosphoribosyltransferase
MSATPALDKELFSAEQIRTRINALADDIARDYGADDILAVSILKGSFVFTADLIRALAGHQVHPLVDFMTLSSYGSSSMSSGKVLLHQELSLPVKGHRVLLIDDILDTGLTLQTACKLLLQKGATDVRTCVLLDKPSRRIAPITADYIGFQIEDVFVVGYGLDYNNRYRHLPGLATLKFDVAPGAT